MVNSDDENDKSVHPVPKRKDEKSVLLKAWAKIEEPSDVTSKSGVERSTLQMPNRDTTLSVYAKDLEDDNGSRRRWSNAETGDSILESPKRDAAEPRRPEERINSRKPRSALSSKLDEKSRHPMPNRGKEDPGRPRDLESKLKPS